MLINPLPYAETSQTPLSDAPHPDALPYPECKALVDADMFVYAAGFAVEHREPIAYNAEGQIIGQWRNKAKYNKWCKEHPDEASKVADLDVYEWVESLDEAELILRLKRKMIVDVTKHGNHHRQAWFLTKGSTLWRNTDAKIQAYKGNRKVMTKPIYYDELREFLINKFKAKMCHGLEADDSVAATGRDEEGRVIICSGDKDLLTVPGWHLNIGKISEGVQYNTPLQACRKIYTQMLMGDRIDNIKGLSGTKDSPGWGIKKATAAMEEFITEYDMAQFVAKQYAAKYPHGVTVEDGETHLTWQEMLVETANLLFLRRYHGTQFTWEE